MSKSNGTKVVRKLPLPLEIRFGSDATLFDGFFSVTGKDAGIVKIVSVDSDETGTYATCEIYPPKNDKTPSKRLTDFSNDTLIGTDLSKSRGLGEKFGCYKYFKRLDGSLYAAVESSGGTRRLQLGNPQNLNSPIAIMMRIIKTNFYPGEFSKKQLAPLVPKQLSYGQIMKATLDAMCFEGYLQKTQVRVRGRFRETFKATEKMKPFPVTPEQA